MPIFFPPPPPFIGGRQPAEPRRLTPPSVDSPPLMRNTMVALAIIALSWQATAAQALPPRAPQLVQPTQGAVTNDPPFDSRRAPFAPIYLTWKWRPVGAGGPGAPIADLPPPVSDAALTPILAGWVPPPLPLQRVLHAPIASVTAAVDNPPFGLRSRLGPIIEASQLPQIILLWQAVLAQEVALDQPFVRSLAPVLAAWQPRPPLPARPTRLVQPGVAPSPTDPPFDLRTALWPIVRAWEPTPLRTQAAAHAPPATVVPGPVDDPPFGIRPWLWTVQVRWQPGPPTPPLVRDVVVTESGIPPEPPTLTQILLGPLTFVHAGAGAITATHGGASVITTTHAGAGALTVTHAGAAAVTFTHAGAGPITREV